MGQERTAVQLRPLSQPVCEGAGNSRCLVFHCFLDMQGQCQAARCMLIYWVLQNNLEIDRGFLYSPALPVLMQAQVLIFSSDICACQDSPWTCEDTCLIWAPHTESGQLSPSLAAALVSVASLFANCLSSLFHSQFHGLAAAWVIIFLSPNFLDSSHPPSYLFLAHIFKAQPNSYSQTSHSLSFSDAQEPRKPGNSGAEFLLDLG